MLRLGYMAGVCTHRHSTILCGAILTTRGTTGIGICATTHIIGTIQATIHTTIRTTTIHITTQHRPNYGHSGNRFNTDERRHSSSRYTSPTSNQNYGKNLNGGRVGTTIRNSGTTSSGMNHSRVSAGSSSSSSRYNTTSGRSTTESRSGSNSNFRSSSSSNRSSVSSSSSNTSRSNSSSNFRSSSSSSSRSSSSSSSSSNFRSSGGSSSSGRTSSRR